MGRSSRIAAAFVGIAAFALHGGCKKRAAVEEEAPPRPAAGADVTLSPEAFESARLAIEPVEADGLGSAIVAAGNLGFAQDRVAHVGALVSGRVTELRVRPGDHVRAGGVLAVLESLEVGRARSEYVAAVARREQASLELDRERKLRAQELSTERRLVEAQTESRLAELGVRAASERLRSVGVDPIRLADVERAAPTSMVELRSPIAGEVVEVRAAIGESIGAGTVFVVGSIDVLWLEIDVYERDLRRVRVGDTARISTIALPGTITTGTVEHIHATVDPVRRVADVRIVLPNPEGILRPGMSATARILVASEPEGAGRSDAGAGARGPVLFVKRAAVQLIDGQPFVFVERTKGTFELRAIDRGEDVGDGFAVRSGLRSGERVVTDGAFLLKSELLREQLGKNN